MDGSGSWSKVTGGSVTQIVVHEGFLWGVGTGKDVWKHAMDGSGSWSKVTGGSVTQVMVCGV